jgi:hypothetical protein
VESGAAEAAKEPRKNGANMNPILRQLACLALLPAASAVAQDGALLLETTRCIDRGDEFVVDLVLAPDAPGVVGLQSALSYNGAVLEFIGEEAGDAPFDLPIYFAHDQTFTRIDLAVGLTPPNAPSQGGVVAKRLRFRVRENATACLVQQAVRFRSDKLVRNLLTDSSGTALTPGLTQLPTLNVGAAPTVSVPPDVVQAPPVGSLSISPALGTTTASGCGPNLNITFVRSDGKPNINDPFHRIDSPISITWTATDECGRTDSKVQTVTVDAAFSDFSGDGFVDSADLAVVLAAFAMPGTTGDANGDGVVDGADIAVILSSWSPAP